MNKAIVDAGPLIAYLDGDDQWHSWSVRTLNGIDDVPHTSDRRHFSVYRRNRNQTIPLLCPA